MQKSDAGDASNSPVFLSPKDSWQQVSGASLSSSGEGSLKKKNMDLAKDLGTISHNKLFSSIKLLGIFDLLKLRAYLIGCYQAVRIFNSIYSS